MCLVTLCGLFCGCEQQNQLTNYDIFITYNDFTKTAEGSVVCDYFNTSNNALSLVMFDLYANAFSEAADGMAVGVSSEAKAYPNGKNYGGIEISDVKVNSNKVDFALEGKADTKLCVPLVENLFPDERAKIEIDFSINLPNVNHRFGWGDNAVNFANFYPVACRYTEGDGFCKDEYIANGDPFCSDVANYSVTVSYPQNMKIACGGDEIKSRTNGELLTTTFTSKKVRDVSFVLSEKFNHISAKTGKTTVDYFYYDDSDAQGSLASATQAVEFFNDKFGEYPYSNLAVVQTNFVHGGMEYPRLVMISDQVRGEEYKYVIIHEIAHQWWYGVVGNDEYNEPWLDESLTEYSTALFYENHDSYALSYDSIVNGASETYKIFLKIYGSVTGEVDTSMNRSLDEFKTEPEYVNNIYTRGILMFDSLRNVLGEQKFYACLKTYYKKYAFKITSTDDFIDCFSRKSGINLQTFFDSWLNGEVEFVIE